LGIHTRPSATLGDLFHEIPFQTETFDKDVSQYLFGDLIV
jgi:hypothetical protein